jgi:LysM repeat protein
MIVDQLFTPKPLEEGGPYDLPGKDYDRPGDTPRKQSSDEHNPYPYSPEEDDDYFREIFRKKREAKDQGVAEGPTDDPRFQKMMGNIQKSTPKYVPVTGYVAVSFASEQGSKKIKGVSRNGKPIPTNIGDPDQFLSGKIEFTPDQVEQQLMSIGKKYGWDSIDSGQSQGFTEMFFDTAKEYTSNNYPYLATNIVKTVREINKFFADINKSLQTTGLPGYVSDVWQGMGPPENTNQIEDLDQIISIAKKTAAKADPGPEIGKVILANYKRFGGEDGYSRSELDQAAKIAKIYITQGERAGFQAQHNSDVSDMIDELLSDAGSDVRTIYTDDPLNPMQIEDQGVAEKAGDLRPKLGTARDKGKSVRKWRNDRGLNESMLMEDPVYRNFKQLGQYIAEQKLTEPEILQIFSNAETGMTDKGTGANRTFLGRGKDTTMDFAGGVADALKTVWGDLQKSVPVAAVDVAYDQATDALANLTGGQKGAVMQAIKKYRNLAKQYPKTAGLSKAALVAIAGLATGGAGLPAVAALVYGLDSAIKGEKFSDIALKAGGAGATAWAGGKLFGSDPNAFDPGSGTGWDASQTPGGPADTNALSNVNQMGDYNGDYVNMPDGSDTVSPLVAPPPDLATYTVQPLDNLSKIADRFNTSVAELKGLNPQLAAASGATGGQGMNVDVIFPGQQITLPPGTPGADVYAGGVGTNANTMADIASGQVPDSAITQGMAAKGQAAADAVSGRADNLASMAQQAGSAPIDYSQTGPISTDSLGQKLEYGMPVTDTGNFVPPNPNLPADELAKQTAAYNSWKADFMKRNPNIYINADGNQMEILNKPTLPAAVQESVKFKIIPASRLIDQKATVLNWALNESVGRRSHSVNLTAVGTYTVFENVERYRQALLEYAGNTQPGRPELPDEYRPDMSGGAGVPSKPGLIGRGLNYLDRGVKKVGGALSNFGHQFTTNVTKEKLKMNWHQARKPSDSDQLAVWLVGQGVPQPVVTSVFSKMGIPYTAPTAQATAQPTAQPAGQPAAQTAAPVKTGGAQKEMPQYGTNPATGKIWTYDELVAPETGLTPAPGAATGTAPNPDVAAAYNASLKAGKPASIPKPAAGPKTMGARRTNVKKPTAPIAPTATNINNFTSTYGPGLKNSNQPEPQGTVLDLDKFRKDRAAKQDFAKSGYMAPASESRIARVLKKPVAEMLQMVETKEDVQKIKQFVDQTFVKYGAVTESAFAVRNQILEHVTQAGAQRRREHSQRVAH